MAEGPDLVTGATGFVGSHLVRALRKRGRHVRALVREGTNPDALTMLGVEVVPGDVTDADGFCAAAHGASRIFHVAGFVSFLAEERKHLETVNVGGVRNAVDAARYGGASTLVVTSSVAAVGGGDGREEVDETRPWHGDESLGYAATKHEGERVAMAAAKEGLRTVCVNPAIVLGPLDPRPSLGGDYVRKAAGSTSFSVDCVQAFVDVRDVAEGHILAAEKGRSGQRYILSSESLPMRVFVAMVREEAGKKGVILPLPKLLLPVAAYVAEWWADQRGTAPLFTREQARMARRHAAFSSAKARRDLGWMPRPVKESVADTVAWFEDNGML
jgi:dihydroflavonol-4-reductase